MTTDTSIWNTRNWVTLPLSDSDVELLVHMHVKSEASPDERVRDPWPNNTPDEGRTLLRAAVDRINEAASEVTGKPGNVIHSGQPSPNGTVPTIRLRILTANPYVEVPADA
jgi:hypothetical protein